MTDITVTKELAASTFEQIIKELGADTEITTCAIWIYGNEGKLPSCAVGQVYHRLVDPITWEANDSQGIPRLGWDPDDEAARYLRYLQAVQDSMNPLRPGHNFTWAEAHTIASSRKLYDRWESYVEGYEDHREMNERITMEYLLGEAVEIEGLE